MTTTVGYQFHINKCLLIITKFIFKFMFLLFWTIPRGIRGPVSYADLN